jgi:hypothetical protein
MKTTVQKLSLYGKNRSARHADKSDLTETLREPDEEVAPTDEIVNQSDGGHRGHVDKMITLDDHYQTAEDLDELREQLDSSLLLANNLAETLAKSSPGLGSNYYWVVFVLMFGGMFIIQQ